jgi:hypothetical protein
MRTVCFILCALALASAPLSAQSGSVALVESLSVKETATNADAVAVFTYQIGKKYTGFAQGLSDLKDAGLIPADVSYDENAPLRRGFLSLLTARYLKLNDSLWYSLFEGGRYAYRACAAAGVMKQELSEWDTISGPELIECAGKLSPEITADEK